MGELVLDDAIPDAQLRPEIAACKSATYFASEASPPSPFRSAAMRR